MSKREREEEERGTGERGSRNVRRSCERAREKAREAFGPTAKRREGGQLWWNITGTQHQKKSVANRAIATTPHDPFPPISLFPQGALGLPKKCEAFGALIIHRSCDSHFEPGMRQVPGRRNAALSSSDSFDKKIMPDKVNDMRGAKEGRGGQMQTKRIRRRW